MRFKGTCCGMLLAFVLSGWAGNAEKGGFLPEFEALPPSLRMPRKANVSIAPEGHFLVNGTARYLPGVIFYEGTDFSIPYPAFGYPDSLKFLYENILDYEGLQRVGFDTVGLFTPTSWMSRFRKNYREKRDWKQYRRAADSGLPLYVDFTCSGWHHGALRADRDGLPKEAFLSGHFMPYNMLHPLGRRFYLEMWREGARTLRKLGAEPVCYELFNEPGPTVLSPEGRREFVRRMQAKYRTIDALNRVWKTNYSSFSEVGGFSRLAENPVRNIEWILFTEDVFYELCREGIRTIREVDPRPEAGFCIQPVNLRTNGINNYKINRLMSWISSSTGGGDSVQGHFLRGMADGKPISDGEMYTGNTRDSFRNAYLTEFSRGFNVSYLFKWDKRSMDWVTFRKTPDGKQEFDIEKSIAKARRSAEIFRYNVLNPWAVPTEALRGIQDAGRDIADVAFLFAPRDRGVPRQAALLYSYPTDHVAVALGHTCRRLLETYSLALEYAHIPQDMMFEEQLPEGRQNRYRVLIAAGVDAVYEKTPEYLRQFVRSGGTLLLGQEVLDRGELSLLRENNSFPGIRSGREIPSAEVSSFRWKKGEYVASLYKTTSPGAGWTALASIGSVPVLFERKEGKGSVLFLNASMPMESLGRFLRDLLAEKGIAPVCEVTDAETGKPVPSIEVNKAVRDGVTGYLIANRGLGSRLVEFRPPESGVFCRIDHRRAEAPRTILARENGACVLLLRPGDVVILAGGDRARLEKRFGKMPCLSREASLQEGRSILKQERAARKENRAAYQVDPNRIRTIDLRAHANRSFVDSVAGDGKGGWTDQGENSLRGVGWGIRNCAGVPMEFIRIDQNDNRACIVLGSKKMPDLPLAVRGIRVNCKGKNLYFLHATAWSGGHSFSYLVHYADGSTVEVPIRDGIEVGDWFRATSRAPGMTAYPGWWNSEGKGLYLWRWENPHPEKTIRSLDIVSQNRNSIPIVVAISVEQLSEEDAERRVLAFRKEKNGWFRLAEAFALPSGFEMGTLVLKLKMNWPLTLSFDKAFSLRPERYRAEKNGWRHVFVPLNALLKNPRASFSRFRLTPAEGVELAELSVLCWRKFPGLNPESGSITPVPWRAGQVALRIAGDCVELPILDKGTNWCGGFLEISPEVPVDGRTCSLLRFSCNSLPDSWGKYREVPGLQISVTGTDDAGGVLTTPYLPVKFAEKMDTDPATWQNAEVNMARASVWKKIRSVKKIHLQYTYVPVQRSGIILRNLHFSR